MVQTSRSTHSFVPVPRAVGFSPLSVVRSKECRSAPLSCPLSSKRRTFLCQAEAQTPKEPSTTEAVLDYALGQGIYQFVAAALGVCFVAFAFAAPPVTEKFFGISLLPLAELLVRNNGAALLIPIAMALSLQSAVEANRLDSPTYKRMAFTLALAMLAGLIIKMVYLSKGIVAGSVGVWITSFIQVLPTIAFLKLYGSSMLGDIIPGFISGVTSLFEPDNINSALYSIFSVVTMILALGAIVKPDIYASFFIAAPVDAFAKFLLQAQGTMMFLLSIVCFTLKDSADRDRLGFTTFRNLNIAAFGVSVTKIAVSLYVNKKVIDAAAVAAAPAKSGAKTAVETVSKILFTRNGLIVLLVIFSGLAVLSGFNAITAKKE